MDKAQPAPVTASAPGLQFRYFDLVMAAFVTILLLSNLIGASKPSYIALPNGEQWPFGAGVLFFPVSYIIGDVLTEIYGYARARRVIWTGFAALAFMAFMAWAVVNLPAAAGWDGYAKYPLARYPRLRAYVDQHYRPTDVRAGVVLYRRVREA